MTENELEEIFHYEVGRLGGLAVKLIGTTRGMPDRMVLLPGGRIFLVELKTGQGRLSALQIIWHRRAAARGTEVVVLRGLADVNRWIAEQT